LPRFCGASRVDHSIDWADNFLLANGFARLQPGACR
jgi:hypothetical protein